MSSQIPCSTTRSLDRSIARSIGRSVDRSLDRSLGRTLDRSIAGSLVRSDDRSLDRSLGRSIDRSVARSLGLPCTVLRLHLLYEQLLLFLHVHACLGSQTWNMHIDADVQVVVFDG